MAGLPLAPPQPIPKMEPIEEMAELTSDSEPPSEREEPPARPQRASARGRGATSKAKSEKAEPRSAVQQRKHLALQEKNRRAQRRFRERQKLRVVELEEQVAALSQQLSTLLMERDVLAQRNLELEAASVSAGNNANNNFIGESPRVIISRPMPQPASEVCSDAGHSPSVACSQGMTLTPKLGGQDVVLSPMDLCNMTQPTLSGHFCSLVKECARTFVEGAGTPEVDERVCQLVDQALSLWQRVGQCNPTAAKQFATCKLDEKGRGQPADERAPHIVRSLGLTDRQKAELCNLRRLFLQRVNTIAAGRSSAAGLNLGSTVPYGGTSGRTLASHQLAARQASRHIASSLQEEHTTAVEFETMVTRHVLAPAQVAQLLIQSYPWPPDCLALATWVAAESGEAEALGALAAEAQVRAASAAAVVAGKQIHPVGVKKMIPPMEKSHSLPQGLVPQSPFMTGAAPPTLISAPTSSVNTCLPTGVPMNTFR